MKHFLIYTNKHKDQELATTKRIQNYLETKGCTVKLKVKESDWKEEFTPARFRRTSPSSPLLTRPCTAGSSPILLNISWDPTWGWNRLPS